MSERTVAHGSSWLARIVAVAALVVGESAVAWADEATAPVDRAVPTASLLVPQAAARGPVERIAAVRARASLVPPANVAPPMAAASGADERPRLADTTASFTPQRLVEQAAQHLADAEAALRRQSHYSAKASAMESLRLLAEARDYADDETMAAEQLREGLAAIRESNDFMGRFGPTEPADIERMVASHTTEALKGVDAARLSGASAADAYLNTARERLASVAAGNPVATRALIVLAEIYRQEKGLGAHADAIAVNLLRAALQSTPSDPVLANELGFLLMKQGILEEAQWALERSVAIAPTVSAAQNLVEVMRQRGDLRGATALVARLNDPQGPFAKPTQPLPGPSVELLTPSQFAALSRPQQAFAPSAVREATLIPQPPAANPQVGAAETPASVETPQTKPVSGPVGRVARAVSGWFQ